MNLKTDLGIDLVKQRAIFDSLQEQIPDLSADEEPEFRELETIAQVLDYLNRDRETAACADRLQKKTSLSAIPL